MEYIKYEHNLKDGDVIVRIYNKDFFAIGIYLEKPFLKFTYIGESFKKFGGLSKFHSYSIGLNSTDYKYRYATYKEVEELLNNYDYKNSEIRQKIIKFKNRLRKDKLNNLNM